jgi:hypothetical protein
VSFYFVFFPLSVQRFGLRALYLLSRLSTSWAHPLPFLLLVIFQIGSGPTSDCDFPAYTSFVTGITWVHSACLLRQGVFCQGWLLTVILLTFIS